MTKIRKGKRKPRAVRPESKNLVVGYDSNWEYELHTGILDSWSCHTDKLPYTVDHHYHPDFNNWNNRFFIPIRLRQYFYS